MVRIEAVEIFCAGNNGVSELQSGLDIPLLSKVPEGAYIFQTIALIITLQLCPSHGKRQKISVQLFEYGHLEKPPHPVICCVLRCPTLSG
jgi:hypothetical protein